MKDSIRKLMHNTELLVITTGKGNWRSALEAVSKARSLLSEIERDVASQMKAEEEEKRKTQDKTVRVG